ncbi:hypothetical protein FQA39_LY08179 [Lamprigera yunnana]|nr:hypothetical protein FQA39_LY08179 [Lamprigera yunnana]
MSIRIVSSVLQKKAQVELNENVNTIQDDIKHIKEWLKQQPHLEFNPDDQVILNFLRGSKYSLQKTKKKLDMFYTMKTLLPEFYKNRDPLSSELHYILQQGLCLPLPKHDTNPQVIYVRLSVNDVSKIKFSDVLKVALMIIDILLKDDDNFIISGQCGFIDFANATMNHVVNLDLGVCKKAFECLHYAYPTRPKGGYFINTPTYFEKIVDLVKLWFPKKIAERVFIFNTNNVHQLYEYVPLTSIPKECGGDGPTLDELTGYWLDKVTSYRNWFLDDEKICSNESKRIIDNGTLPELFNSFRKLDID